MVGDTKITDEEGQGEKLFGSSYKLVKSIGALKTIILSENIVLAYAGELGIIDKTLDKVFMSGPNNQNILDILADATKDDSCEFIIAYTNENLYKIHKGEVIEQDQCHIGSQKFWKEFQKKRNFSTCPKEIIDSIYELSQKPIDNTVGGFIVSLCYDKTLNKFIYLYRLESYNGNITNTPQNSLIQLIGDSQTGGYAYEYMTYKYYWDFLAIKFLQTNKTFVFVPYRLTINKDCQYRNLFLPFDTSFILLN